MSSARRGEVELGEDSVRGHLLLAKMVVDGLQNLKQGKAMDYHRTVENLSVTPMKASLMHEWLQALSLCVSNFSRSHDQLVNSSLKLIWYEDEVTANYYIEYLTNLLSAQTYYLRSVLLSLVQHFWAVPVVSGNSSAGDKVFENIHRAVQAVLVLIPTASSVLMPLLSKGFPFRRKSVEVQELALRNVLYVSLYCPSLRDNIFELAVHQMLAIDVELPNFEDEEDEDVMQSDEEEEEETSQGIRFHVELEGEESCVSLADLPSILGLHCSKKQVMKNEQAEKLDVMMSVSLHHILMLCQHKNGNLQYEAARNVLYSLIKIFECILLPTHACSSVQFLLFKLTSLHKDFPGYFLDFLWDKFQDPNTPAVLRQTAAAYIASYIARSKFVSLETAKLCLTVITGWIHGYLDTVSPETMKPDVKQHGPFFSLCQALFYIFVFRHKHLLESSGGPEFLRRLNFERIITSRLNPLKVCLPSVVEVFASLANRHEIAFCYSILEQNKRIILTSTPFGGASGGDSTKNYLDCFFPFDPYRLKRSGKSIRSLCQEWEDPTSAVQDDDATSSLECSSSHFS